MYQTYKESQGELEQLKQKIKDLESTSLTPEELQAEGNYRKFHSDMLHSNNSPLEAERDAAELRRLGEILQAVNQKQEAKEKELFKLRADLVNLEKELIGWRNHRKFLLEKYRPDLDADIIRIDRDIQHKQYIQEREENSLFSEVREIDDNISDLDGKLQQKPKTGFLCKDKPNDVIAIMLEIDKLKLDRQSIVTRRYPQLKRYIASIQEEIDTLERTKAARLKNFDDGLTNDNINILRISGGDNDVM